MHVILLILTIVLSNGEVHSRAIPAPSAAACNAVLASTKEDLKKVENVRGVDARCVEVVIPDIA